MLRSTKFRTFLTAFSALAVAFVVMASGQAHAITGSDWRAGNIISDAVFYDNNSMSAQAIQNFLNSKVPTCDTNGSQIYSGNQTRAQYGASRGYPAPYTCLKDYSQNGLSSAQIIKNAADTYSVNPKALLVLLQKEQTLVTDDWPWSSQYRSATGYGCPDTAACDSQYYGFYNQVMNAARQFRLYANSPANYRYKPYQSNYIQYNPNANCGGTNVTIENKATAGLYNYTPYQPNASALNNLYGTGDGCGAYGNRNFWRLFSDWFGNTTGYDYAWGMDDISISTGSSVVNGDQPATITITAKNLGNQAWSKTNFPVRLGTFSPTNHDSALYDSSWFNAHRPTTMTEDLVQPGSSGHFTFTINPPNREGVYEEQFNLVADGATWFYGNGYQLHLIVDRTSYSWQMVSQSSSSGSFEIPPGQTAQLTLVAKNTGDVTWSNSTNPVRLGTFNPTNRSSAFYDSSWILPVRPALLQETSVAPGQNGTFVFTARAPSREGFYAERFNLVMDGKTWLDDPWMEFDISVKRRLTWQMVSQASASNSFTLSPGQTTQFTLVAKNTGNLTWSSSSNPVRLGTWNPANRTSAFQNSWSNPARPAVLQETSVAPGQNGTFVFSVKAPAQRGFYVERFNLAMDGVAWMDDPWLEFDVLVQ